MSSTGSVERCPNCHTVVTGPFCAGCGQRHRDLDQPFRELLVEVVGTFWAFDRRIVRTLAPLLTRPGFLTKEFLAGRRARYVHPFKLFFALSVLLFIVLATTGQSMVKINDDDTVVAAPVLDEPAGPADDVAKLQPSAEPVEEPSRFMRGIIAVGEMVEEDPEGFNRLFIDRLAKIVVLLVPLFAGLLRLLYWRSRYVAQLVFSLHVHSFAFLALLLGGAIDMIVGSGAEDGPGAALAVVAIAVYVLMALRRVSGQRLLLTFAKTVVLGVGYLGLMMMTLIVTLVATVVTF